MFSFCHTVDGAEIFTSKNSVRREHSRGIHIKLGNMKMKAFHNAINIWDEVLSMSREYKLIRVYKEKIEGIG